MKEVKPTKRDVSKLLGRKVKGWNDKRKKHNRIKLTERLTLSEVQKLHDDLVFKFPDYQFLVSDVRWLSSYWCGEQSLIVTAVSYWKPLRCQHPGVLAPAL